MDRLRRNRTTDTEWRVCLECGNRYEARNYGYRKNWCSPACESSALRRQRERIQGTWMCAGWFFR